MSNTNASAKTIKYTSGKTFLPVFIPKTWNGLNPLGSDVWTDGENIYYSSGSSQYVLNKETDTWEAKTWYGTDYFAGSDVWTDGENIYYKFSHKLNKETDIWEEKTWYGLPDLNTMYAPWVNGATPIAQFIWTDGENIYFSYYHYQYKLNKETDTWEEITLGVLLNYSWITYNLKVINGAVYTGNMGYIYRVEDDRLVPITRDDYCYDLMHVWTDGENIYYSSGSSQYVLEKETFKRTVKTWNGLTNFSGENVWTDGENIYYSSGSSQYVLNKETDTWEAKTWNGLTNFVRNSIWTDGENIYLSKYSSNGDLHYKLNRETDTWEEKTWNGLASKNCGVYGSTVWTDGTNIYNEYLGGSYQYVLNKETDTWEKKTFKGFPSTKSAENIWTDGENIYCGFSHKLNKETDTWEAKTWYGTDYFAGNDVWTDGSNYYVSRNSSLEHCIIKNGGTPSIISNLSCLGGKEIWTDGTNVYTQRETYDSSLNKWVLTGLRGCSNFNSTRTQNIWTDGENIYLSYGGSSYVLLPSDTKCYQKTEDGWKEIIDLSDPSSAALITKSITANGTYKASDDGTDGYSNVIVNIPDSPLPIEVAAEGEMTALLETAESGAVYKYTGETTSTYEQGALYILEEASE